MTVTFLQFLDLSANTNLRSVSIDSLQLLHRMDEIFPPLISMLSRIASPFLEDISLILMEECPNYINGVPWYELARIFDAHSTSRATVNIRVRLSRILSDTDSPPSRFYRESTMRRIKQQIIAGVHDARLKEKLSAMINISYS